MPSVLGLGAAKYTGADNAVPLESTKSEAW